MATPACRHRWHQCPLRPGAGARPDRPGHGAALRRLRFPRTGLECLPGFACRPRPAGARAARRHCHRQPRGGRPGAHDQSPLGIFHRRHEGRLRLRDLFGGQRFQRTGLGVSGLIPCDEGWTALRSEGGHVTFSPANPTEIAILQYAWNRFEHVSAERLLSGVGLELIYSALANHTGQVDEQLTAPAIVERALGGAGMLCDQVVEAFCGMLGTVAGNLAVTLGAQGGVYIGGGIVPRLGERFAASSFRRRFEQKGRFVNYLSAVPTWVITAEYPAFLGVSALLAEKLDAVTA